MSDVQTHYSTLLCSILYCISTTNLALVYEKKIKLHGMNTLQLMKKEPIAKRINEEVGYEGTPFAGDVLQDAGNVDLGLRSMQKVI